MKWNKSTKCDTGTCVEVAIVDGDGAMCSNMVAVRNSMIPGEVAWFTAAEWTAFVAGVKDGQFDL